MKFHLFHKIKEIVGSFLYDVIVEFTCFVNRIKDKLCVTNPYPNPNRFQDLTPTSDCDEDKVYSKAIKWALENKKITNLAITGSYGSGKSSILSAFEKEHCEYKYLNISLASFKDGSEKPEELGPKRNQIENGKPNQKCPSTGPETIEKLVDSETEQENLIELSILQQIFYHVKAKQIPDSRFKRIKSLKNPILVIKSVLLVIWLMAGILFFNFPLASVVILWDRVESLIPLTTLQKTYIPTLIFFAGAAYLAKKLLRVLNNAKFNKLNVQNGEFELCKNDEQSILNKHIDEILYFFEVTEFNVVFIEDLDRFESTEIFTKLRELNILINRSKQVGRRVVFIYAIKDDRFRDGNRTKFFDFIIPVIPVVNVSNSGAKFLKFFELEKENNKGISKEFIEDISYFITDMRLLKNIYNEYVIYRENIGKTLDYNLLLGMVIYKNMYPSDFVELQYNRGTLYNTIKWKDELVSKEIENKRNQIIILKDEKAKYSKERLDNVNDLRSIYIYRIIEKVNMIKVFWLNKNECDFVNVKKDTYFDLLKKNDVIYYKNQLTHDPRSSGLRFSDLNISGELTYEEREKLINDKHNGKIEELQLQIEDLEAQIRNLKKKSLSEIIKSNQQSNSYSVLSANPLIFYLLRNDYINENYQHYMSVFYDGFLTNDDNVFLQNVKSRKSLNFDYKLTCISNVVKKIWLHEWEGAEVLNVNIMDFLLTNTTEYLLQIDAILAFLINKSELSIRFIDFYIEHGENVPVFLLRVSNCWSGFWEFILKKTEYSNHRKDVYLKKLIESLDEEEILSQDKNKALSNYITFKDDFIDIFSSESYQEKIYRVLSLLSIKFEKLTYTGTSNWLTDFICSNSSYKLNPTNIRLFLRLGAPNGSDELKNITYTVVQKAGLPVLKEYIEKYIEIFVKNTLLDTQAGIYEDQIYFVMLLENEDITNDSKIVLIQKYKYQIDSLINVKNTALYSTILLNSKMAIAWENVVHYIKTINQTLDKNLIQYLNEENHYLVLTKNKLNVGYDVNEEFLKTIAKAILECNELTDTTYRYLLNSVPYKIENLNYTILNKNKIMSLLDYNFISLTEENFKKLKDNFPNAHFNFLVKYREEFVKKSNEFPLDANDFITILNSDHFNIEQKVTIIHSNAEIFLKDNTLQELAIDILSIWQSDKSEFFKVEFILKSGCDFQDKLKIFSNTLSEFNSEEISVLLVLLGEPYSLIPQSEKPVNFEEDANNITLVEKLKKKGYIHSFKKENGEIIVFRNAIEAEPEDKAELRENREDDKLV